MPFVTFLPPISVFFNVYLMTRLSATANDDENVSVLISLAKINC